MIALLSIIVLGFFLGMRHATDPDHVIAVTTIVSRQRSMRHAALIGALWGVGHTITIFLVGSAIILFGVVIPPRLGLTMELSVGLMLILLGVLNLSGILRWVSENFTPAAGHTHGRWHSHAHAHGDFVHTHPHAHSGDEGFATDRTDARTPGGGDFADKSAQARVPVLPGPTHAEEATPVSRLDRVFGQLGVYQAVRPLVVGLVHGLAGSAAVALLVLTTIRVPVWAVIYLLVFGVGTIAGMMVITAAIAAPFAYSEKRFTRVNRALGTASGLISLGFGLFIVYQMGYVNGLLGAHPNWTPR